MDCRGPAYQPDGKELDLAPMTTHEWSVPANLIDPDELEVECRNYTDMSLVFRWKMD